MRLPPWLFRRMPLSATIALFAALGAVVSPVFAHHWLRNRREDAGWRTRTALELRVRNDDRFAHVSFVPMAEGVTVVCGRLAATKDLAALHGVVHSTAPAGPVTCSLIVGRTDVPDRFFQMSPAQSAQWLEEAARIERRRNLY